MKTIVPFAAMTVLALLSGGCSKSANGSEGKDARASAAATGQNASKPEIASKTPEDWMVVQDENYIPVIDDLSRKMQSAHKAFLAKDPATAAADVRATADLLSKETPGSSPGSKESIDLAMKQLSALAADLDGKKTIATPRFEGVMATAHRADLDRDWVVLDETSWYPYIEEPDRHFQSAHQSFVAKDYAKAAEEMRKGAAFVKLEAGRASGDVRSSLNSSAQELEKLATGTQKGTVKNVKDVDQAFQRADHALARSHQIKAKDSWTKKETAKAGHEMKAAALHLEQAAAWTGDEAKSAVSAIVKDTRTVAAKLTAGSGYAVDEVDKGIDDLGKAISDFGKKAVPGK